MTMRYVEDPSIAVAARAEHAEMMAAILARYEAGENYFVAREAVMAEHGPRIAKELGKEAAKRALAAVCSHDVSDCPRDSRIMHAIVAHERDLEHERRYWGPDLDWSKRQRWMIRNFGAAHWSVMPMPLVAFALIWPAAAGAMAMWGPTSPPALILFGIGLAAAADKVLASARPVGRRLHGLEQQLWQREQDEADERRAAEAYNAELDRKAAEADEQAKWRGAQRAIRGYARQVEKEADTRASAILPDAPPLDDVGEAILKPKGAR